MSTKQKQLPNRNPFPHAPTARTTAETVVHHRLVRRFRVHGIAMVPVEVVVTVDAESARHAMRLAQQKFKASPVKYIVPNSEEHGAVWDWRPCAERADERGGSAPMTMQNTETDNAENPSHDPLGSGRRTTAARERRNAAGWAV